MLKFIFGGIATFIIVFLVLGLLLPAATCMDGWKSGAIGRSGACSHHGGVDRITGEVRFWLSLGAALAMGFYIRRREQKSSPANHPRLESAAVSACPQCQGATFKYEKTDGTRFWECGNPACLWTSDAES